MRLAMLRAGIGILLLGAACRSALSQGPGAPATGTEYVVPFRYDPPALPYIVVEARVNGAAGLKLIVDTGASPAVLIDRWAAESLGLPHGPAATVMPGAVRLAETTLDEVTVKCAGPASYVRLPFRRALIADLGYVRRSFGGLKIAGVIGAPLFALGAVRLDFTARTLTLCRQAPPSAGNPGSATLPLASRNGGLLTRLSAPKGAPIGVMIDTGSDHTSLKPGQIARMHTLARATALSGTFDGAIHLGELSRLEGLRLGDYVAPDVVVDDQPPAGWPILGLDLLSRFNPTFDLRHGRLLLERPADYAERVRLTGWTGIVLAGSNGRYQVRRVQTGSPAVRTGIRPGDRLIGIDDRPAAAMEPQSVRAVLDGFAGQPARIVLERAGSRFDVGFTRADAFADPTRKSLGFAASKPPGRPFVVDAVRKDSRAAKAGLRAGDELIELNGVLTADLTWDRMSDVLERPKHSVTVRSKDGTLRTLRL